MGLSREHELLENLLAHPAWEHILKPVITEKVTLYYSQLLSPTQGRKDVAPDDYLRGAIEALRWVVTYPQAEIDAAKEEAAREEAAAREAAEEVPLFGGGRPTFETGEDHGRSGESGSGQ
jgi:hypothetical protein